LGASRILSSSKNGDAIECGGTLERLATRVRITHGGVPVSQRRVALINLLREIDVWYASNQSVRDELHRPSMLPFRSNGQSLVRPKYWPSVLSMRMICCFKPGIP